MIRFKTISGAMAQVRTVEAQVGSPEICTVSVLRQMPDKGGLADSLTIQAGMLNDGYLSSVDERSRMRMKLNLLNTNNVAYYSRCAFLTEGLVQMDNSFLANYPAIMAEKNPEWQLNGLRVRPDRIEFLYHRSEDEAYEEVFLDDKQFNALIEIECALKKVVTLRVFWQRRRIPAIGEVTGYCVERSVSDARNNGWRRLYVCAPVAHPERHYICVTHEVAKDAVADELQEILRSDGDSYHYYGF